MDELLTVIWISLIGIITDNLAIVLEQERLPYRIRLLLSSKLNLKRQWRREKGGLTDIGSLIPCTNPSPVATVLTNDQVFLRFSNPLSRMSISPTPDQS